ncbi:hypothetical protein L218DRAFT_1079649 [Marasmius fiardii PR-910]|nr:hypothetical protein L218DRAFT_1079649 [Marasmius fiardii PR-910]
MPSYRSSRSSQNNHDPFNPLTTRLTSLQSEQSFTFNHTLSPTLSLRRAPDDSSGSRRPPKIRLTLSPEELAAYQTRLEVARKQGDLATMLRMESLIKVGREGVEHDYNYLGMPYTPEVHGPLRRMDLSNGLDFVYWDT